MPNDQVPRTSNCARSFRNAARTILGTLRAIISECRARSNRNAARDDLGIRNLLLHALRNPALAESRLEVVGDGPEAGDLRKLAARLGIASRVVWHGAITDEARLAPIANECRLFCYPGAVGLSLVHAMAYGLPAVLHGNRWHHMPEIAAFSAGETGLSFHEGSTESLAKAIGQLINDPAALDRMSANAIATVKAHFNTSYMADRMVRIYVNPIDKPSR